MAAMMGEIAAKIFATRFRQAPASRRSTDRLALAPQRNRCATRAEPRIRWHLADSADCRSLLTRPCSGNNRGPGRRKPGCEMARLAARQPFGAPSASRKRVLDRAAALSGPAGGLCLCDLLDPAAENDRP